jgi:hypothetical protein
MKKIILFRYNISNKIPLYLQQIQTNHAHVEVRNQR